MDDFKQVMSELSDEALVKIVEYQHDEYQPEALESAKNELKDRNMPPGDLEAIRLKIENKEDFRGLQTFDYDTVQNTDDLVNPESEKPINRKMQFYFFLLSVFCIFFIVDQHRKILISLDTLLSGYDIFPPIIIIDGILYILPFILFPVGLLSYYKHKKYGWHLMIIIIAYWIINLADSIITYWQNFARDWDYILKYGDELEKMTYYFTIQHGWFHYVLRLAICLIAIYPLSTRIIKDHLGIKHLDFYISFFIAFAMYFLLDFLTRGTGPTPL